MSEAKTYIAGLIQNARAAQKEFEGSPLRERLMRLYELSL